MIESSTKCYFLTIAKIIAFQSFLGSVEYWRDEVDEWSVWNVFPIHIWVKAKCKISYMN